MSLLLITYPQLDTKDVEIIDWIKTQHPALKHSPLPPHFTLVFPTDGIETSDFINHIKTTVARFPPFPFVIRCALPFRDHSTDDTYVFLVPDEGFSDFVHLHDTVYTGLLQPSLRLDLPFVPHITVGYHHEPQFCKEIADNINRQSFEMRGMIRSLEVIEKTADGLITVEHIHLNG